MRLLNQKTDVLIQMVERILTDYFSPQEPQTSKHPPVFGAVQREHPLFTGYGVLSAGGYTAPLFFPPVVTQK